MEGDPSAGENAGPAALMSQRLPLEFRSSTVQCKLLRTPVSAIVVHQDDGVWRIVNCLDKHEGCYRLECPFTTDHAAWPYDATTVAAPPPRPS